MKSKFVLHNITKVALMRFVILSCLFIGVSHLASLRALNETRQEQIYRIRRPSILVSLVAISSPGNDSNRLGLPVNTPASQTLAPPEVRPTTTPLPLSISSAPLPQTTTPVHTDQRTTTLSSPENTQTPATTDQPNSDAPFDVINPATPSLPGQRFPTPNGPAGTLLHPAALGRDQFDYDQCVFLHSVFIVYISLVKLAYHNVPLIKNSITEPGILISFGIIWELVLRQVTNNLEVLPRFNARIFFYLFLPSTVLESASALANKWIFLNLLPILIHSIIGTLIYAASLGFTIYALTQDTGFTSNLRSPSQSVASVLSSSSQSDFIQEYNQSSRQIPAWPQSLQAFQMSLGEKNPAGPNDRYPLDLNPGVASVGVASALSGAAGNLTIGDCLIFGTILSSIDSSGLLNALRYYQANEKLYYTVLGENLLNNAVVLVLFNLVIEFFNTTRFTLVKIYFAILQFFVTLIGAAFIGTSVAILALICIRLTKHFQVANLLSTSYQNQCQTMVETLLILKFAYFSYSLSALTGTSSILSLAAFGILQDQYIKINLNLRSQFTLRQLILATKTMGYTLIYPLIGMLLVEYASASQIFYSSWFSFESIHLSRLDAPSGPIVASQANTRQYQVDRSMQWNLKLLSLITALTILYRFVVVFSLSLLSNLFAGQKFKIKFREQILIAYGGLKGPLALALAHRLSELQQEQQIQQQERVSARNKHLLMIYTILFVCFVSNIIKGPFIRPLVAKMQLSLCHSPISLSASSSTIVFNEISCMVTDYVGQALNSVLGHSRSPCDRFIEFNETHIKPWLAGRSVGLSTNWLSQFYDNLTLDEIMNSNCFHRSLRQESSRYLARLPPGESGNEQVIQLAVGSGQLNDGRETEPHIAVINRSKQTSILGRNLEPESALSLVANRESLEMATGSRGQRLRSQRETAESEVLRELVLYNLKMSGRKKGPQGDHIDKRDRARIRPTQHDDRSRLRVEQYPDVNNDATSGKMLLMMRSTSSTDPSGEKLANRRAIRAEQLKAIEKRSRAEKRHHLMQIEQYLSDTSTGNSMPIADSHSPASNRHNGHRSHQQQGQLESIATQNRLDRSEESKFRSSRVKPHDARGTETRFGL